MQKQVIEFGGLPVGIVVPASGQLRFMAVKYHVMDLDGQLFASPAAVRKAIGSMLSQRQLVA
ncbi:MAG: hypothetical protein RLZZ444_661 [Pseudomonadota bacterium]|jgi:hypothetical protein